MNRETPKDMTEPVARAVPPLPNRSAGPLPRRHGGRLAAALLSVALGAAPVAAQAQKRPQTIIRDAEIEALLRDYAEPVLKAAGLGASGADIVIVRDDDFNAFVASGSRIFIHTGTLMAAATPNEVIGVIAHETGHLASGHLQTLRSQMARARAIGAVASILGAGAAVAGASGNSRNVARAGAAATTMGPGIAARTLLAYRREQEIAADRAALGYLSRTGQSASGMVTTFRRFASEQLIRKQYADPYLQSHPLASERLAQLERTAAEAPGWDAGDPPRLQLRHDLMRAKLAGFLGSPESVAQRYPAADRSLPAAHARAIRSYRSGDIQAAIAGVNALIKAVPSYAYFPELKGQILLESGRARDAVAPLREAVSLAPRAGLVRILLGQALLATDDPALLGEAVANLRTGLDAEPFAAAGHRHLAIALQKQGRVADAELAIAEGLLIEGDVDAARGFARRAQAKLTAGTPAWLQADDIINYKMPDADG